MSGILLLTDDLEAFQRLAGMHAPEVRFAVPAGIAGGMMLFRDEAGQELRLACPETPVLGFVRTSANAELASAVAAWWRLKGGFELDVFPPGNDPPPDRADLFVWLFKRMSAAAIQCAKQTVATSAQNRELRNNYMFLQRRFATLEALLAARKIDLTELAGRTGAAEIHLPFSTGGGRLTQVLPVLDNDTSALGLYFRRLDTSAQGHLDIRLWRQPCNLQAAFWRVSCDRLLDGLNVFEIGDVIDATNDELVLEIEWDADAKGIEAGFSSTHQDSAYFYDGPSFGFKQRSLAVEIWRGRNGGRQPQILFGAERQAPGEYSQIENISFDVLKRLSEYKYAGSAQRDYPLIQIFGDRILVHPASARPTLAYVPQRLPLGVRSVRVQCETRHERASAIEYAMAIVSSTADVETVFENGIGAADGFSGWRRLQAMESQYLTAALKEPVESPHYVFLATRLPEGSGEAYGWATWRNLQYLHGDGPGFESAAADIHASAGAGQIAVEADCMPAAVPPQPALSNFQFDHETFFSATFHAYEQVAGYDPQSVRPAGEGLLLVHPRGYFPTIARLEGAVPAGCTVISVNVQTIQDKASVIEYAMAVVPAGIPPHEFFDGRQGPSHAFTGWTSVAPQIEQGLSLRLEAPSIGGETLCLATRLRPGDTDMYCWSCFASPVFNPQDADASSVEVAGAS